MSQTRAGQATMHDKLVALVDRVWQPSSATASPVAVTAGEAPEGHVAVETYAVVPSLSRPRFLIPLGSRRAAVACLWTYHTMRAPHRRVAEATVSAMFGAGLGPWVFPHRLVVSVDRRVPQGQYADWLILDHLTKTLGGPRLYAGLAVRRLQPNAKPMLELYDDQGRARGFAKIGWSMATKQLVRQEADVLAALRGRLSRVVVPTLLAHGAFAENEYSVVTPLPRGLRRWAKDPLSFPEVPLEAARAATMSHAPLAGSAYARELRDALTSTIGDAPEESQVLLDWLSRLERRSTDLEFGRWHGDWMPHNLGQAEGFVAAWDWEHSRVDVPLGFDALHWHYQQALARAGIESAAAEVDAMSVRLGSFGVPPDARHLVASLYLLEMFLRSLTLALGGGGWNPRIYPKMLEIAARRDR